MKLSPSTGENVCRLRFGKGKGYFRRSRKGIRKKPENALAVHVDSEDKTTTLIQGTGSNYKTRVVMINEILRRAEDIIGRTLRMLNAPSCNPSHFKAFQSLGTPCFNGVKREIKQSSNQAFTHLLDARKAVPAQGFHYLRNLNI